MSNNNGSESCLKSILLAPFRFIWWLLKAVIWGIVFAITFGAVSDWWDSRK